MSVKIDRIASNIVKEISYILAYEIKDADIKFVTVTDCKLSSDLSYAKIYVTVLDDSKKETTLKGLFVQEMQKNMNKENLSQEEKEIIEKAIEIGFEALE